ncbi:unnamed protein product [Scytosiphon promiscuus]
MPSRSPVPPYGKETLAGVMVNGYWFPSLAAAAEAPAGKGFNFAEAAEVAAADAVHAKEARRRLKISRRCKVERKAIPKGLDFTSGAVLISCPSPRDASEDLGTPQASGVQQQRPSMLRRWAMRVFEKTGLMERAQQTVRDYVPRMPRETLLLVAGIAGGELAKREIAAQVEALEEPVREPAWALLNETYKNFEARAAELVESDWDFASLVSKQLAEWKRRGVGNSYQEALLKDVIQLQTMALLRPVSLPAEEGSLMVQLNATYRSIEESIGRLLPQQTKEQLSLLEGLLKKLDEKGIGELSFDEVYRALLLGAVPPALVTDAVRLLAAGRPTGEGGDGGGAAFLSDEGAGAATAAAQAYYGSGGDVTLAALAARLNDTQEISRVMTYTALAAETEVIENLREVLDGLQSNIRKSLEDIEAELKQPPPPSLVQGVTSYVNNAARSAVTVAIEGFNNASRVFDASFEALADCSHGRPGPRPGPTSPREKTTFSRTPNRSGSALPPTLFWQTAPSPPSRTAMTTISTTTKVVAGGEILAAAAAVSLPTSCGRRQARMLRGNRTTGRRLYRGGATTLRDGAQSEQLHPWRSGTRRMGAPPTGGIRAGRPVGDGKAEKLTGRGVEDR